MSRLTRFDPLGDAVVQEPADFYAALRAEAPLFQLPNGVHVISRFEDVKRATLDTDTFSSNLVAIIMSGSGRAEDSQVLELSSGREQPTDVLAIADPPQHTRHRKVTNRAFTPRRVAAFEPRIRELADSLVEDYVSRGGGDWVADVAVPLPMTIIVELLGLPPGDTGYLKDLSDAAVATLSGINTEAQMLEHSIKVQEMLRYMGQRFDEAVLAPGDSVLGDLAVAAQEEGEFFTREGVMGMLLQLLTAGNESTASLIGSAMLLLLRDDALQRRLRDDPLLIEAFIEETLRLESPFKGHFRITRKDTQVGGVPLAAGSRVMLLWGSANRDETAFDDPPRVDLSRQPLRTHMAFGYGIHQCIGAPLARAEARIAIETVLARTDWLRLAPGNDFAYIPSLLVRGLRELRVACGHCPGD